MVMVKATWIILLIGTAAMAAPPAGYAPVDQAVADLDRLTISLRRVEPGLRVGDGEKTALFAPMQWPGQSSRAMVAAIPDRTSDSSSPFYRIGPGFRAKVDRIDYLIKIDKHEYAVNVAPIQDGKFIELVSPNTVFDLQPVLPIPATVSTQAAQAVQALPDWSLPRQIDAHLERRIERQIQPRPIGERTNLPDSQ